MTLGEILKMWRVRTDDLAAPYLWSDLEGVVFANAAQNEACVRANLLQSDDADSQICNIDGTANEAVYQLDSRIIEVRACTWGGHFLDVIDRDTLNEPHITTNATVYGSYFEHPRWMGRADWSTLTGTPRFYMVEQEKNLTLIRKPTLAAPIHLSVYRYPLEQMSLTALGEPPEIPELHHLDLIDWMEHLSYDNVDADKGDPERAAKKAKSFTDKFGERPSADTLRSRKANRSNQVRMNPDW